MSEFEKIDLLKDIYYSKDYTDLYLSEGEEIFEFDYCDGKNKFYNLSVKRIIDKIGNSPINDGYYDLETAYGYGGFYSTTQDDEFLRAAMGAYHERCSDEKIIAEFLRFHPYNSFPFAAPNCLDFLVCDRQTVAIDLSTPKDLRWLGYSSTTRNILRKSSTVMQFNQTDDIDEFMSLYELTMKKNGANSFYYFKKDYYEKLLLKKNVKLFSVTHDSVITNMSFILLGKQLAHYHLSANNANLTKLGGNYFLLDSVCDFISSNNPEISEFHLGGGRSNLVGDSLLAFKSKFSKIRNNFYIAGKIFNPSVYWHYAKQFDLLYPEYNNSRHFLKYRAEVL